MVNTEVQGEKYVRVSHRLPQIPHGQFWKCNWPSSITNRQLKHERRKTLLTFCN